LSQHCCDRMDDDLARTCDRHPDRTDCPDALISFDSRGYGLMVHDGGSASITIIYCPWCGSNLTEKQT
jgi:hypothetical protein